MHMCIVRIYWCDIPFNSTSSFNSLLLGHSRSRAAKRPWPTFQPHKTSPPHIVSTKHPTQADGPDICPHLVTVSCWEFDLLFVVLQVCFERAAWNGDELCHRSKGRCGGEMSCVTYSNELPLTPSPSSLFIAYNKLIINLGFSKQGPKNCLLFILRGCLYIMKLRNLSVTHNLILQRISALSAGPTSSITKYQRHQKLYPWTQSLSYVYENAQRVWVYAQLVTMAHAGTCVW